MIDKEIKYTGFWDRLKASIVDYYAISIITATVAAIITIILSLFVSGLLLDEITSLSTDRVGLNALFTSDLLSEILEISSEQILLSEPEPDVEFLDYFIAKTLFFGYIFNIIFLLVISSYLTIMLAMKRQCTYGLHIFDAVIVDRDMKRLSYLHSFLRSVATILVIFCTFGLGFLTIAFRKDKRGLNDIIANTYVIYDKRVVYVAKKVPSNLEGNLKEYSPGIYYSGFWNRSFAFLLDSIIGGILLLSVSGGSKFILGFAYDPFNFVPITIFFALYNILQICSSNQATFGMRALGMIMVDNNFKRLSYSQGCFRYVIVVAILNVSYGVFGFITMIFRKDKKCLQDIFAKTYVIDKE